MEELLAELTNSLNKAVEITKDEEKLLIELKVKKKILIPGDLGTPNEIAEMIRLFGGVKDDIQMKINVDENTQTITLKCLKREDYEVINAASKQIWDRVSDFIIKAFYAEPGKIDIFRDFGDFDETY